MTFQFLAGFKAQKTQNHLKKDKPVTDDASILQMRDIFERFLDLACMK